MQVQYTVRACWHYFMWQLSTSDTHTPNAASGSACKDACARQVVWRGHQPRAVVHASGQRCSTELSWYCATSITDTAGPLTCNPTWGFNTVDAAYGL